MLEDLQRRLSYTFASPALLERAVTHPSFLQDHPDATESNQRLEFLGDAVLQFILTEKLFELYPEEREGKLSKRRAALTKGSFLVMLALEVGIDQALRMGFSEEQSGGRNRPAALEDAFEALIGALYLDGGIAAARKVVLSLYGSLPDRLAPVLDSENPKGRLQELIQPAHGNTALRYEVTAITGRDHARVFEVVVCLGKRAIGSGTGSSKKVAEEAAAKAALEGLGSASEGGARCP